jgi:glycerophosphoryl diester phosphodiesterase
MPSTSYSRAPRGKGLSAACQVFQGLVDANLVGWVHEHGLLILAWTVNDSQRLNQLVRLGVDSVTTANLAILRALG